MPRGWRGLTRRAFALWPDQPAALYGDLLVARQDLVSRISEARAKKKGLSLNIDDVVELSEQVGSLAKFYVAFDSAALQLTVPPEVLVVAILDSLCLGNGEGEVTVARRGTDWHLAGGGGRPLAVDENPLVAINQYRELAGAQPLSGVQVGIPGPLVRESVEAMSAS